MENNGYNGKIGRISEDEPVVGSKRLTLFVGSKAAFLNELLKSSNGMF